MRRGLIHGGGGPGPALRRRRGNLLKCGIHRHRKHFGLGLRPLGGLVQYPCTFRNASGVSNARVSADMALAGTYSIVPFDEVCKAMKEVGDAMPASLRETGIGGLAGTDTAKTLCGKIFG